MDRKYHYYLKYFILLCSTKITNTKISSTMRKIYLTAQEKENRYITLATEFLKEKNPQPHYMVDYMSLIDDIEPFDCKAITDEKRKELEAMIAEVEAEGSDLREFFCDDEIPEYIALGVSENDPYYGSVPVAVRFDTRYFKLDVKVAAFYNGIDNAPTIHEASIFITEEEYISLLAWQMSNRQGSFNDLLAANHELFSTINAKLKNGWSDPNFEHFAAAYSPIFAVELVGVKADAEQALGEPSAHFAIYEKFESDSVEQALLDIEERVLSFGYHSSNIDGDSSKYVVDGVDAIAVEKAFGVDSYRDVALRLTEEFGGSDGVKSFQKFLDDNNIQYTLVQ